MARKPEDNQTSYRQRLRDRAAQAQQAREQVDAAVAKAAADVEAKDKAPATPPAAPAAPPATPAAPPVAPAAPAVTVSRPQPVQPSAPPQPAAPPADTAGPPASPSDGQ